MLIAALRAWSRLLLPALVLLLACAASPAASEDKVVHPAMWVVHGPKGTAYFLGSIHALPSGLNWKTPEIMAAMKRADTFLFEVPMDHLDKDIKKGQTLQLTLMDNKGLLPPGESLRSMMPAKLVETYDKALDKLHLAQGYVDRLEPWLAYTLVELTRGIGADADRENGVDVNVYAMANDMHKKTGGLETVDDQWAILTKQEQKEGIAALGDELTSIVATDRDSEIKTFDALVAAWSNADVAGIMKFTNDGVGKDAAFKKAILDDRNARWVGELKRMLAEDHVYFITVGCAHLVGPLGVPARLRAAGFSVEGPGFSAGRGPLPAMRLGSSSAGLRLAAAK